MDGLQVPKRGSRWKHKGSGEVSRVIGRASGVGLRMGTIGDDPLVIFSRLMAESGDWMVMPLSEFMDGRFEEVTQAVRQQG